MKSTDYSLPPQWLHELFIDFYGIDMKGDGPSLFHIISTAFYFAAHLDYIKKENAHVEEIQQVIKSHFDDDFFQELEITRFVEDARKTVFQANDFSEDQDKINLMQSYFFLLKKEIIKISNMMR